MEHGLAALPCKDGSCNGLHERQPGLQGISQDCKAAAWAAHGHLSCLIHGASISVAERPWQACSCIPV